MRGWIGIFDVAESMHAEFWTPREMAWMIHKRCPTLQMKSVRKISRSTFFVESDEVTERHLMEIREIFEPFEETKDGETREDGVLMFDVQGGELMMAEIQQGFDQFVYDVVRDKEYKISKYESENRKRGPGVVGVFNSMKLASMTPREIHWMLEERMLCKVKVGAIRKLVDAVFFEVMQLEIIEEKWLANAFQAEVVVYDSLSCELLMYELGNLEHSAFFPAKNARDAEQSALRLKLLAHERNENQVSGSGKAVEAKVESKTKAEGNSEKTESFARKEERKDSESLLIINLESLGISKRNHSGNTTMKQ
jgi:hypothetical protein